MRVILIAIGLALVLPMFYLCVMPVCAGDIEAPAAAYDLELYVLGYDVFLANGNPRDAFSLAEKAIAARPNDPEWRRRAARSGEWSGNFVKALEHWYFLATVLSDQDALRQALRLARELRDFQKLKSLLEPGLASGDDKVLREYVSVCEQMGVPEDAIKALELKRGGPSGKYALEQLARLYEAVGQPEDAIAAWLELVARHNGATAPILLRAASLAYGRGDVLSAYTIMNLGRKKIAHNEHEYWAMLGDLDWAMQNTKGALLDARVMIGEGKGRSDDYQRLIDANQDKDRIAVYDLALEGWRRFKIASFFYTLLESGIALNRHAEMVSLLREAGAEGVLKPFEEYSYYWSLLSRIYQGIGNYAESLRCYREALLRSSDDGALLAGYIWLLLDLDRRKELQDVLQSWQGREIKLPVLCEPFGAAYAFLGDNYRALRFFQARYRDKRNDPAWIAAYADVLEQTGRSESAFQERLRALRLTRGRIIAVGKASDEEVKRLGQDYVRLAMRVEPGDALDALMHGIAGGRQDGTTRELVAAWALSTERNDFARLWYWREYAAMTKHPRWIELALAMEEYDRPRIGRLLSDDLQRLPYRDAIEAALRTGQRGLAEQLAFEWGAKNPDDHLLYEQTRELYGQHPSFARYRLDLSNRGGVGIGQHAVTVSQPATRHWTVLAEGKETNFTTFRSGVIGVLPEKEVSGKIGATYLMERGEASLFAGGRAALESFPFVTASADYRPSSRWRVALGLNYSDIADETAALRIGGVKDMASLSVAYQPVPRDSVTGRATAFAFRDQERETLGGGGSFEAEYGHIFTSAYPDWRGRLFGGYFHYTRNVLPQGALLSLIPAGAAQDAAFFVPDSFGQMGFGLSCGSASLSSYTRQWRPFGGSDVIWNSRSGMGWRYELGAHGPLLGLDKLRLGVSQDSGSYGLSEMNTVLEMEYQYYFN